MTPQILIDGLIAGSMIGLGAIGVTLTYSILRFANFAHGDMISWGAYFAYAGSALLGLASTSLTSPIAPFSFGWSLPLATVDCGGADGGPRAARRCRSVRPVAGATERRDYSRHGELRRGADPAQPVGVHFYVAAGLFHQGTADCHPTGRWYASDAGPVADAGARCGRGHCAST